VTVALGLLEMVKARRLPIAVQARMKASDVGWQRMSAIKFRLWQRGARAGRRPYHEMGER
jgi:hypothetical protein